MTLDDLIAKIGFFMNLQLKSVAFARWCHATN